MKTLCSFGVLMMASFVGKAALGVLANYAFFGLQSPSAIPQLTTDEPLVVYTAPLNRLRNYYPGDDLTALLERSSQVIVPLLVSTNVRSSISFSLNVTGNTVSSVKFGRRKLIRELMSVYRSIPPGQAKADGARFVVEIPVFDIWLIGYVNVQDQLELLATIDLPLRDVHVGQGQRISEAAMLELARMTQPHDGTRIETFSEAESYSGRRYRVETRN